MQANMNLVHLPMLKADLDGTIFAYDYRARLAYVMTSRQIVSQRRKMQNFPSGFRGFSPRK